MKHLSCFPSARKMPAAILRPAGLPLTAVGLRIRVFQSRLLRTSGPVKVNREARQ